MATVAQTWGARFQQTGAHILFTADRDRSMSLVFEARELIEDALDVHDLYRTQEDEQAQFLERFRTRYAHLIDS